MPRFQIPSRGVVALSLVALGVVRSAIGADAIVPSPRLPQSAPWNLKQLGDPPKVEWVDQQQPVYSLFYAGEPYGGKPTRVFAYYATPATLVGKASAEPDAKYPAVVLIHGGGGTAFREWAELWAKRGYAAIAMDTAGYRPHEGANAHQKENRARLADGGPDQGDAEKFGSVDKPPAEQWPYHAVAAVIRAHSLIRSFPEVDANRTAVTGISWGGYLTCIVAGVDSRFRAAAPVYGCGYLHENSVWRDRFARMSPEQASRWTTLWDPSRYLPSVSMPILFVNGTNDFAYPLDSYLKSFDAVPGEKQLRITVKMPHSHPAGWAPAEIGQFFDHHLLGKPALPTVGEPRIAGGRATVACESSLPLQSAALHFTTSEEPVNKREWQTVEAQIEGNRISATAPPAEATAWFFTVGNERGGTVSSRVMLKPVN